MTFFGRKASRASNLLQPERRSSVRILTLKNTMWFALSVTVLFLIVTSYMERRQRGNADYGRLYDSRIEAPAPASAPK